MVRRALTEITSSLHFQRAYNDLMEPASRSMTHWLSLGYRYNSVHTAIAPTVHAARTDKLGYRNDQPALLFGDVEAAAAAAMPWETDDKTVADEEEEVSGIGSAVTNTQFVEVLCMAEVEVVVPPSSSSTTTTIDEAVTICMEGEAVNVTPLDTVAGGVVMGVNWMPAAADVLAADPPLIGPVASPACEGRLPFPLEGEDNTEAAA